MLPVKSDEDSIPTELIVEAIEALEPQDKHELQQLCGLLVACFGEHPRKSAVIIMDNGGTITFANINAGLQETYELLNAASTAFNEQVVGAVPPVEMRH